MPTTALARGTELTWELIAPGSAKVALPGHGARGLHFRFDAGRLDVAMELVTGNKVDITVKPGLVETLMTESAHHLDLDAAPVHRRLRDELVRLCAQPAPRSAPRPEQISHLELRAILLALSYPLTTPALVAGATPLGDVPRWAVPVLAEMDARSALTALVGAAGTNRRGARALVESLSPSGGSPTGATIALYPLALAAVGAGTLDAERTANVLGATDRFHPEREWPTPDEISMMRQALRLIGAERGSRVLHDAAGSPDGPRRLVATARAMLQLTTLLPRRLPASLDELERLCAELTPTDPRGDTIERSPHENRQEGQVAMVDRVFGTTTPVQHTDVGPRPATFRYEPDVAAVDGATTDDGRLTLVLPRTPAELAAWGCMLHNCAADYRDRISNRRTTLIGVRHDGQLAYLIEWRRPGVIRQFFGARNHRVPHMHVVAVMELLWHHRLIRADVFAGLETGSAVPLAAD